MTIEKKKNFIINAVYYAIVVSLAGVVAVFALKYLAPFIFGFLIAFLLKPVVNKLTRHFGEYNIIRILVIVLFYILVGFAIVGVFLLLVSAVQNIYASLPTFYQTTLAPVIDSIVEGFETLFDSINPEIMANLETVFEGALTSLKSLVGSASSGTISFVASFITSVPSLLVSILIAVISSFFFTLDYQVIVNRVMSIMPERWQVLVLDTKETFTGTVGKYLVAYAKLMSITFIELSIAFLIIGVDNPIGFAFMIACVDIFPVLGTGTIMIPWVIIEFLVGDPRLGIALLVVYVLITVIRNILEPRIVGKQIGLHPLVTLICIFVGMRLAGFAGLFGLPIFVTIVKSLHDQGKIGFFNKLRPEAVKEDNGAMTE